MLKDHWQAFRHSPASKFLQTAWLRSTTQRILALLDPHCPRQMTIFLLARQLSQQQPHLLAPAFIASALQHQIWTFLLHSHQWALSLVTLHNQCLQACNSETVFNAAAQGQQIGTVPPSSLHPSWRKGLHRPSDQFMSAPILRGLRTRHPQTPWAVPPRAVPAW